MSQELRVAYRSESIDVTTVSWSYAGGGVRRPIAIQCNAQSTIVGALMKDATETTWVLPIGRSEYAFRYITTASATKNGIKILYEDT